MYAAFGTALLSRYNTDATMADLRASLPGGLWKHPAPEGRTYPLATYMVMEDIPVYTLSDETMEQLVMQITLWTRSSSVLVVSGIYVLWTTAFDDISLVVPGHNPFLFERISSVPIRDEDTGGESIQITYRIYM